MTRRMVKTVDCTVDVSEEMPGRGDTNSSVSCRIRFFVSGDSVQERPPSLLPALPILILCWTVTGGGILPPNWLESYVGLLHIGIASFPRPVTLIERFTGGEHGGTVRRVFFCNSKGRKSGGMMATFQSVYCDEVEAAIGERLSAETITGEAGERNHGVMGSEDLFPLFGKRGPCYQSGRSARYGIGSLGEAIHEAAVSLDSGTENGLILDEHIEYAGYHNSRSLCRVRVFTQNRKRLGRGTDTPLVVIFTELADNPGTSITNRFEHLATVLYERLGRPEPEPIWIEHYEPRGVYNKVRGRWQFPEEFDFVELRRGPDGYFHSPVWKPTSRMTVEVILGRQLNG